MTYSKAVAILTANSKFNVVDKYYQRVPFEPAADGFTLAVDKVVRVADLSFQKLLQTMIDLSSQFDMFLFVEHGLSVDKKTVTELGMPLADGSKTKTRQDLLEKLLKFMNEGGTDEEMAKLEKKQLSKLPEGSIYQIVQKMKELRKKKVRWVNIRACAVGNNPSFLETLGRCFSALFINAPDVHMFYSDEMLPHKKAVQASYDAFAKMGGVRAFDDGAGQGLALQATGSGPLRHVTGKTSSDELHWFMDKYFDKGHRYPSGNGFFPFQIEGMDVTGPQRFALPNEPEYVQHIVWKGPLPDNEIGKP